jgi:uncharacterized protein (DUF58 family)
VPGDEIKHIDWKVWSKTDRLYIKEYEEETNLKCTILLDCSRSMRLRRARQGRGLSKFDYGATSPPAWPTCFRSSRTRSGWSRSTPPCA